MSLRQAVLVGAMATFVRPGLKRVKTPESARRRFERTARLLFRIPPCTWFHDDSVPAAGGSRMAMWSESSARATRAVVLYFHGGGYIAGSPHTHRVITGRLAREAGVRVFAPDYRLAPESPFPAALEDARAAFTELRRRGYRPGDIVIGGDSAGGGLALALLAQLCAEGEAPAAAFAFSPWTDLALTGDSLEGNRRSDVILLPSRIREMRDYYANGADPRDPRLSPLYADFPGCPPVLLQVSEAEILADDAFRMARALENGGVRVRLETWANSPHVWQIFDGWIPEAREALQNSGRFIRRALGLPRLPSGN